MNLILAIALGAVILISFAESLFIFVCIILLILLCAMILSNLLSEDLYSDTAIQKAKLKEYPSNLSFEEIMNYKIKERVAILGLNSFKELYEQYPDYLRPVEKRHLANIGKIVLIREDAPEYTAEEKSVNLNDHLMDYDLDKRMELLDVDDYTEMCKLYPEYVTDEEFEDLLAKGHINSVDDIVEFKGRYYENEHSEEWEEFEYEWDKDHRR